MAEIQLYDRVPRVYHAKKAGITTGNSENVNTTAFDSLVSTVRTNGGGKIVFPAGVHNIKITAPNTLDFELLWIEGEYHGYHLFGTIGDFPLPNQGTILQSADTTGYAVGVAQNTLPGNYEGFSNWKVVLRNLEVRSYNNPSINGIDLYYAQQCRLENVYSNTGLYPVQASEPTNLKSGIITPATNNGAISILRNVVVGGYYNGIKAYEHTDGDNININACYHGVNFQATNHGSRFGRLCSQRCRNQITVSGSHYFTIEQLALEHLNTATGQADSNNLWQDTQYEINDPSNLGKGNLRYINIKGDVGYVSTFRKNGGTSVHCSEIGTA
jgi:hypothetical protein